MSCALTGNDWEGGMTKKNHTARWLSLLLLITILLPACGTLEVGIVRSTDIAPTATEMLPVSATATPMMISVTPTPYVDHWTLTSLPSFGITLERPPDWEADAGYGSPETGDMRFAGPNGFVQVGAIEGNNLDRMVEIEAGHHLQPYGSQPVIENIALQGQAARLIMPSVDQVADFTRQAAVIARYPEPVEIAGQQYDFLILWADQEHIRAIAQTVRFIGYVPLDATTPTPAVPLTWERLPPGLAYTASDGLWLVGLDEQPVHIHNNSQAVLSADGRQLLSYDSLQQDIWLIDRSKGSVMNLTRTPDRVECCFQWWPQRPDTILFGSADAGEAQNLAEMRFYLTTIGIDGEGYQILDTEHPVNVAGYQGTIALSPDGQTIAYGVGTVGWFYHLGGEGIKLWDPAMNGLDVEAPYQIAQPSWSLDGHHLAWIYKRGVAEDGSSKSTGVVVFDLATRTARILHQYESQGVGWPSASVWSPDGQWLAFGNSSPSEDAGLWVAHVNVESEVHHLGLGGNPVWSPDARWLAFQSAGHEVGPPVIYALAEVGVWEIIPLDIPVDRLGMLAAWVNLENGSSTGVTITGTVIDVSLSAQIITLEEPVDGFSTIALAEDSVLLSVDGSEIALEDIQHGTTVKVFGQPGDSGALIANQVLASYENR